MGLPPTVSILGMSISMALVNRILVGHEETAVGVLGIANRLEMFAFVPIFALGGAVAPMVGYNLGARLLGRCRETILTACLIAGSTMAAVGVVLLVFPRHFLWLFTQDASMLSMGTQYLRINAWSYFIIGCDITLSSAFLGLGRPELSMVMQLVRTLIVKVPAAWLLSLALGVTGVWISSPVSTIACFLTASSLMWWLLKRLPAQQAVAAARETSGAVSPRPGC